MVPAPDYEGERILYDVTPVGKLEYSDLGQVDLKGVKTRLVMLKTKVLFFEDTEKIYSDPESFLPYRVERRISGLGRKESITEEYDQKNGLATITKFSEGRKVSEETTPGGGPIHNAILLPFFLRMNPDPEIGWHFNARILPGEFKIELVSIDEITVPAGKFQAYHFKSTPDKFEIWINRDAPRVPLKIQSKGLLTYALVMKEHNAYSP